MRDLNVTNILIIASLVINTLHTAAFIVGVFYMRRASRALQTSSVSGHFR